MAACSFSFNPKGRYVQNQELAGGWKETRPLLSRLERQGGEADFNFDFVTYGSFQSLIWASVLCVFATGRSVEQILVFDIQTDDLPCEPLWKRLRQEKEQMVSARAFSSLSSLLVHTVYSC